MSTGCQKHSQRFCSHPLACPPASEGMAFLCYVRLRKGYTSCTITILYRHSLAHIPNHRASVVAPSLRATVAHPPQCAACASGAETKGSFPQWPRASRSPLRVLEGGRNTSQEAFLLRGHWGGGQPKGFRAGLLDPWLLWDTLPTDPRLSVFCLSSDTTQTPQR